jgi:acyl dehydratase/predicted transcriptional regulator
MLVPVSIREVMNETVATVDAAASVRTVATRLYEADIGSLIVRRGSDPVGIITESDLVALLARECDPDAVTAADCMSAPMITVGAEDSIELAVELFEAHNVKKLPVEIESGIVGIVTTTDLSYYLPHLERSHVTDFEHCRPGVTRDRADTAYEEDDWEFESRGDREDAIDLGDVVRFSKPISEADVEAFAAASGDTNRLHLDDAFARGTRFGRQIAHGTLVAGVISAALARLPGLVIYLSQDVSYLGPVDLEDRVTAVCEVVEELGHERYRLTTSVVDGDGTQVIDGEAVVIADPIPSSDES